MESQRQHKYSKQILKDLAQIFQRNIQDSFHGAFVTLKEVKISPDLAIASIYVSVLPVSKADEVMSIIDQNNKRIRGILGKIIGKQARIVPHLRFFLDNTEEEASKMDSLFENLDIPKKDQSKD
ncbi:MAG: 30S ribosome-binding factor RbfA [Cyclobacteriaceae bacterium]|nr:30S ribosome-binding factor RbfA [Cyclobacteriaceae bacterium]